MKRISLLVFFALGFVIAQAKVPAVSLKNGILFFANYEVSKNWEVKPILDLLGEPSSILDRTNKVYTYNNAGIAVYERKTDANATNQLSEIQFFLGETEKNNITPAGLYKGKVSLQATKIPINTSHDKINTVLSKYVASDSYTKNSYRYEYQGIYMYILFNAAETSILKISIGKVNKAK